MAELKTNSQSDIVIETEENNNTEIWGDNVKIKDLVIAILISAVTTLGGYLIAPNEPPKPLIYGLLGGIIGFIITSIIIKPKRALIISEGGDE